MVEEYQRDVEKLKEDNIPSIRPKQLGTATMVMANTVSPPTVNKGWDILMIDAKH